MSLVCIWGADVVARRPLPSSGQDHDLAKFLSADVPQRTGRGGSVFAAGAKVRIEEHGSARSTQGLRG